jgi:hypothetical protein
MDYQAMKLSPIGQYLDDDIDTDTLFSAQIDKVYTFAKGTAQSLDSLREEVGTDVDHLETGLQSLSLKVGVDPGVNDTPMLSLWEGIEFVLSTVQEIKQTHSGMYTMITEHSQWINQNESKINSSVNTAQSLGNLQYQMNQVLQLVTVLSNENQALSTQLQNMRNQQSSAPS